MEKEEKRSRSLTDTDVAAVVDVSAGESQKYGTGKRAWIRKVLSWGVELRGISPVPLEERTDGRFFNIFFVWWTLSLNLLP
jgi:hypothetical protein